MNEKQKTLNRIPKIINRQQKLDNYTLILLLFFVYLN